MESRENKYLPETARGGYENHSETDSLQKYKVK